MTAALCVNALGKDRVIGVLIPCGEQHGIDCAKQLVKHLNIKYYIINIKDACDGLMSAIPEGISISSHMKNAFKLKPVPSFVC